MEFRIGINLGDIIFEEGDIYGEGVNVAARVEQLADELDRADFLGGAAAVAAGQELEGHDRPVLGLGLPDLAEAAHAP